MAQTTYTTVPVGAGGAGTTYTTTLGGAGGYGPITVNTGAGISSGTISTSALNGTSGAYLTSNGTWGTSPTFTVNSVTPGIQVKGDAEFDGDIKVQGKSLNAWMETMEKRLAILVPNPKKLKQYEALQKAYKHYKMLEALCEEQDDESNQ
jgi:hypothetical protein